MEVTTWTDALATIKPESFGAALAVPCIRQALTFGMVCGFFGAGAAWVSGRPALRVANMAVMTFLGTSPLSFGYCDWERRRERKTVRVVKEAWDAKREEKKLEWEKFREAKLREVQRDGKQKPTPQQKTSSSSWWRSSTGPKGREG
jgi:cytochrome c oxidase assembly protein subunit 20